MSPSKEAVNEKTRCPGTAPWGTPLFSKLVEIRNLKLEMKTEKEHQRCRRKTRRLSSPPLKMIKKELGVSGIVSY